MISNTIWPYIALYLFRQVGQQLGGDGDLQFAEGFSRLVDVGDAGEEGVYLLFAEGLHDLGDVGWVELGDDLVDVVPGFAMQELPDRFDHHVALVSAVFHRFPASPVML